MKDKDNKFRVPWRTLLVTLTFFSVAFTLCSYAPSYPGTEYGGGMHTAPAYEQQTYSPYGEIYTGTYTPLGVSGYTGDGTYYEDGIRDRESGIWGGSSFWEEDYLYEYYLDDNGEWWRCNNGRWQKWINVLGWHWSEVIYQEEPSVPHHEMFKENPAPLDGGVYGIIFMILLALGYAIYKGYKLSEKIREKNEKQD